MIVDCEKCKTGRKALDIHFARKRKEISYHQTVKQLEEIGKICFSCMHNKIKGKKAKAYAITKVITESAGMLSFQSCDWYQPIDEIAEDDSAKMKCPKCGSEMRRYEKFIEVDGLEYPDGFADYCQPCGHDEKVKP